MSESKNYSILIVDDENSNITVLSQILNSDYTVLAAKNGINAIKAAENRQPDVILLDIILPDIDGYAVIAVLKKSEKTRKIPVIFIAGLNDVNDEIKGLSLGAADYITKPFNSEVVKLRVKKQIEILERLRANEYDIMNYKLASEALKIALWSMDVVVGDPVNSDNKFIWSREFRHMLGFSDENDFPNVLRSWSDRLHPDDRDRSVAAFAAHINDRTGETPYYIEYRLRHKSGEYRYYDGFGTTLRDSEGVPIRVSGAIRDVTEKRLMEKALERQNKLLHAVNYAVTTLFNSDIDSFESTLYKSMKILAEAAMLDRVRIWKNDRIDGKLYCSQLYEWSSEQTEFQHGKEITVNISYSEKIPGWEEILSSGKCVNNLVHNLSTEEQVQLSAQNILSLLVVPIFSEEQFWGFVGFDDCHSERIFTKEDESILRSVGLLFVDALFRNEMVVQLKTAAENAIEDEQRMQLMLDAMPLVCHLINRDYTVIDCNREAINLFDATSKSEYCEKFIDYSPEFQSCGKRSAELYTELIDKVYEIGYLRFEWTHQKLNGELLPCEITLVRIGYKGEDIVAAYSRDLREQKAVIEEMRKAEIAVESNKAKSRFLATMSHEIRTPMNSIMGFAELALDSPDNTVPAQIMDYFVKIKDSTKWLLNIVNDILDISKVESGKMELERVPFDLNNVVLRCESVILPSVKEKGLDFQVNSEPLTEKKLIGDAVRLYQSLMNLLSNAVKFTNTGLVKLSSIIKSLDGNTASIYFEVKDSGIGMSPEQVEKVFAPFIQADSSTTRNYGGTGLGLAITKNIIELMGGALDVQSSLGGGSTFSFEIKFDTVDASDDTSDSNKFDIIEKPFFDGLVLICDDNPMNQEVICEHLANVGLRTAIAENGKAGVDMVRGRIEKGKSPFDLIFMDMYMPVMDGMEAATKIMELNTGTPIIAMTANIMASDLERYAAHGIPDYVGKPFTSQELWRVLLKYLKPVKQDIGTRTDAWGNTLYEDELQRRLLINFVKNNQNKYEEIVEAIEVGDIKTAHRLSHTLKGNAGLIGRSELQKIAAKIEMLLKNGINLISEDDMNKLEVELKSVLDELRPLLDEANKITRHLDPDEVAALFEKLEPMLENINPECVNLLDDIIAVEGTEQLARHIENYNFESAVVTLAELKKKWGDCE